MSRRGLGVGPPRRVRVDLPYDGIAPRRAPAREEWIVAAPEGNAINLDGATHVELVKPTVCACQA